MLKRTFRILGLILVFALVFSMGAFAVENTSTEEISNTAAIESLIDQRAAVLARLNLAEDEKEVIALNASLMEIDRSLTNLGVSFLTDEEILEIKSRDPLPDHELMMQPIGDIAEPLIELPESDVNTWMSYITYYRYNNVDYELEVVSVQPKAAGSPFREEGSRTINFSTFWTAGSTNIIETEGYLFGEFLTNDIVPGSVVSVSAYDAVSEYSSQITANTELMVASIAYNWMNLTTVSFIYVSPVLSDYDSRLSYVSTKDYTSIRYTIPSFSYKRPDGSWLTKVNINASESLSVYTTPTGYCNYANAIIHYLGSNNSSLPTTCFIDEVRAYAPENKTIMIYTPDQPNHPVICEPYV